MEDKNVAGKQQGGRIAMVDVGSKRVTQRQARARGFVRLRAPTLSRIRSGRIAKGDVLAAARLAGIMAAKRAAEIVPLCHPIALAHVAVDLALAEGGVEVTAAVSARERTGVEMEALCAVSAAALTIYDMCKSIDRGAVITDIALLEKSGGRSGRYVRKGV